MDKEIVKIPDLKEAVDKATDVAIKRIIDVEGDERIAIQKKQEIIRDVTLSIVGKLQILWDALNLSASDEETLKKYSIWFVKPVKEILEVARKSNVDLYEMKFGRKMVIESKRTIEDFLEGKVIEVKDEAGSEGTDNPVS